MPVTNEPSRKLADPRLRTELVSDLHRHFCRILAETVVLHDNGRPLVGHVAVIIYRKCGLNHANKSVH